MWITVRGRTRPAWRCLQISGYDPKGTENSSRGGDADLAQKLSIPLADLITIPVQMTWDRNIGVRDDGWKPQTNIQPVVPIGLNPDWNLISQT